MLELADSCLPNAGCDRLRSHSWFDCYDVRTCCGVLVTVRASSNAHWHEVRRVLPPNTSGFLGDEGGFAYSVIWGGDLDGTAHELYRGADCIARTMEAATLLRVLQADAEWQVAMQARGYSFVHAGAVTFGGAAIVIPGVSGAGKSTLVTKLLARGGHYYSDEYAVLDGAGRVHPFPCALKLKDGPSGLRSIDPQSLGAPVGGKPCPIQVLAFPTFVPGVAVRSEELSASQGALYLLQHIPAARRRPTAALAAAAAASRTATCLRILHGDSAAAAEALLTRLSTGGTQ